MNMTINLILVLIVAVIAVLIVVSSTVVLIVSLVVSSFALTIVASLLLVFKGFVVIHELIDRGDAGLSVGTHFLMVLKRTACPSRVLRSPGR